MLVPDAAPAASVHTDVATWRPTAARLHLELRRLVRGDLAGMFDGPTSVGIDLNGHLVVIDLSAPSTTAVVAIARPGSR